MENNKKVKNFLAWLVVIVTVIMAFIWLQSGATDENGPITYKDMIRINQPTANAQVSSPLTITGEARGNWYFEASFPVRIEDANGNVLGQHYATAQGEWMTAEYVPFTSELIFNTSTTETGTLILSKDNPSGLPEHEDEVRISIRFSTVSKIDNSKITDPTITEREITLYYYNPEADTDRNGNIKCSEDGLVPVTRRIPITQTPIQDAINLLMAGEITDTEAEQGIETEYPLAGFDLVGASLNDGVLTLSFTDPNNATSGGSCRAGILWFQIRETAKQFDVVNEVRFKPEELFQP